VIFVKAQPDREARRQTGPVGISVTLDDSTPTAPAGTDTTCYVQIVNTGMVVDRITLDVLGEASEWAAVEPPVLNLLPAANGSVRVTFSPPRSPTVLAGEVPFAVRARSQEDPDGSSVEEGTVRVGSYHDLTSSIVPKTSTDKRSASHRLTIENRGNEALNIRLGGVDPDEALSFRFTPDLILAEPGTDTSVKVRVAPRKRFVRGSNKSLPFQVFTLPDDGEPVTTDATMLQRQTMPRWLVPVIAILVIGAVLLVAAWSLAVKPAVQSTATAAQVAEQKALSSAAAQAGAAATAANAAAAGASSAAVAAGGGPAGAAARAAAAAASSSAAAKSAAAAASASREANRAASALISSNVSPGDTQRYAYDIIKPSTSLSVSDIFLQNPQADVGILEIDAGTSPLFRFNLQNFRNLDKSFVQSLTFTKDKPLTLVVSCQNPGTIKCTPGLSFSGQLHK